MSYNFANYAKYYNLLYKDKEYDKEVNYIDSLINKYSDAKVSTLLDVGCGTGNHDLLFANKGYSVTGIDLSANMIEIANDKKNDQTSYFTASAQDFSFDKKFDAVISLFHVMSYQTTNNMLEDAMKNIGKHLNSDGLFIFDFWYGPAVLTDRPGDRKKSLEDDELLINRKTTSKMIPNENKVEVNFDVTIKDKKNNLVENVSEEHFMRYFFLPELKYFLEKTGFTFIDSFAWLSDSVSPSFDSWYGLIIAKKK